MSAQTQPESSFWVRRIGAIGGSLRDSFRILTYSKVGFIGFIAVIAIVLLSYVGPLFVELDTRTKIDQIYLPPSSENWLGTDHQGRDIWSHIVHGGRDVIYVGLVAASLSTFVAVAFGALSGFAGGWIDSVIMFITDVWLTIPNLPLLAVLAAFITINNLTVLGVLLGALGWPVLLRAVRSQTLSLKERDFVEAARALDLGIWHIIFREIVPNMMSYILISFILAMTGAIYAQVALFLLGLINMPIQGSNWGVMVSLAWVRGAIFYKDSVWYIMAPIIAIGLWQLAMVTMARSLELVFNPRLRSGE
ncbi:MAG: ABC transporter permease [Caldilineaceae bacterium]|nr:ABC transporter permease [Caldilineaceae bacterium]